MMYSTSSPARRAVATFLAAGKPEQQRQTGAVTLRSILYTARRAVATLLAASLAASFASAAVASAEEGPKLVRVGAAVTADGEIDRAAYSKLAPWPRADGGYLYSGCYPGAPLLADTIGADRCFMSVDLRDPAQPRRVATVHTYDLERSPAPPPDHAVWSPDYPFANLPVEVPCRIDWSDEDIAAGRKPPACWDPGWNTQSHYVAAIPGKLLAVNQERFRYGTHRQANYHGVRFYDLSDPTEPRFLSYWEAPVSEPDPATGVYPDARGVHHFNFDGSHLFLGTEYRGYVGRVMVILDVGDPRTPVEVGRWALPGQKTPDEDAQRNWIQQRLFSRPIVKTEDGRWTRFVGMHYVTVRDDVAYLAYHQAGLVILDVGDVRAPELLAWADYLNPGADPTNPNVAACLKAAGGRPAACGNTHTARPVPGRDLLVVEDEFFTCPYGHVRLFDIRDPSRPALLSHFLFDENLACDPDRPMSSTEPDRFPIRGPSSHMGIAWDRDTYLTTWYGLGLQVIDISDPREPRAIGRYGYRIADELDQHQPEYAGSDTYDVVIGPEGYLYVADATAGLRVLRFTGREPAGEQVR